MSITIEKEGRRHYIVGNTYAIKNSLRNAGCTWDPQRKAWWTGKVDVAERFSGQEVKSQPREEVTGRDLEVIGRAEYKGRQYLVVWTGQTKYGTGWKLAFRDGSKVFWAGKDDQPRWVKQYQEPTTVGKILDFIERKKAEKSNPPAVPGTDDEWCHNGVHEEISNAPTKRCWECGCSFTYSDAKRYGGDWQDSYCGC